MKGFNDMTPVIFRAEKYGPFKNELTAVFPKLDANPGMMVCYAHIGQHSECCFNWYRKTRPATPEEYNTLLKELVRIGYTDLKVYKRIQH